jgi:hypothetical protein
MRLLIDEGSWCDASAAPATVSGTKAATDHCFLSESGKVLRVGSLQSRIAGSQETCLSTSQLMRSSGVRGR